jgi:putative peptide zinc metalloprotease protein
MTGHRVAPVATGTVNRFRELTAVRDGDGYVVGSPRSPDYLAVPEIGGQVVEWLRAGHGLQRCAELAEAAAGQPVDVARFVAALDDAGLLPDETEVNGDAAAVPVRGRRIGRILFGPTGLVVQLILGLAAVVLLVCVPDLRPTFEDGFIVDAPLAAMLLLAAIGTAAGLLHEVAHVLAAARFGVHSRMSISRRLFVIVYQTDLTGLWGLPRRQRAVPIGAGMTSDAAILGLLLVAELLLPADTHPLVPAAVRALVLLKVTALAFQIEVFMRTDGYALFALATRSRNLWAVKGAVARALVHRTTADDHRLLAVTSPREVKWAKLYLLLYLPGVGWATCYLVEYGIPSIRRIAELSAGAIGADGLFSLAGCGGAAALALCFGPLGWTMWGVAGSAGRTVRRLLRPSSV